MANLSVPNTFTNTTQIADATQVNANFVAITSGLANGSFDYSFANLAVASSISALGATNFYSSVSCAQSMTFNGGVYSKFGSSTATHGPVVSGTNSTNQSQSVNAVQTSIQSYALAASTLGINGDAFEYEVCGTFANNANNKRVQIQWDTGGSAVTVIDSGTAAFQNSTWSVRLVAYRVSATTQKLMGFFLTGDTLVKTKVTFSSGTSTLSNSITIETSGTGVTTGDVSKEVLTTRFIPGT